MGEEERGVITATLVQEDVIDDMGTNVRAGQKYSGQYD